MAEQNSKTTLYFGYGSNLWKDQMAQRCPTSMYLGIARLRNYRWIINSRGYANVVETTTTTTTAAAADEVWGLVYSLQAADEARLDINEGVPIAYTKEDLRVDFWAAEEGMPIDVSGQQQQPRAVDMLVYIDRRRMTPDEPKKEYVYRMNMGIRDALVEGVPEEYIDRVLRAFIPSEQDDGVEGLARKQALRFEEE